MHWQTRLGERQIIIDCDVLQADGGTRCASITGGWVALKLATNQLLQKGIINNDPIIETVAAVSCGVYANNVILDLDYAEDSEAETDANFVLTDTNKIIEVQGSAEGAPFSRKQLNLMTDLAEKGVQELVSIQTSAVYNHNA